MTHKKFIAGRIVVVHTFNPSIQKAEATWSTELVPGQPRLYAKKPGLKKTNETKQHNYYKRIENFSLSPDKI